MSYGQGTTETERAAAGRTGGAPAPARAPAAAAAGARPEASARGSPGAGAPGPAGDAGAPAAAEPGPNPIQGFNFRDARLMGGAWRREARPELLREFFRALAVCHTVIPDGAPRRSVACARGASQAAGRSVAPERHVSCMCGQLRAAQHQRLLPPCPGAFPQTVGSKPRLLRGHQLHSRVEHIF